MDNFKENQTNGRELDPVSFIFLSFFFLFRDLAFGILTFFACKLM